MLKPSRLYIKIFLSFLAVLLVTELFILILFLATTGRMIRDRFQDYTQAKLMVAGALIEEKSRSGSQADLAGLLKFLGNQDQARMWLIDAQGRVLAQSFDGPIPAPPERSPSLENSRVKLVRLWRHKDHGASYYGEAKLTLWPDRPAALGVLFLEPEPARSGGPFVLGLLVIGLIIALLIYPVARHITRPLRDLRRSALRIADGELSHRAHLSSRDELGDLGRAFNHMAERVEAMVRGGRELTANVSHEIRTPLTRIRIATEMLHEQLSGSLSGRQLDYLEGIHEDIGEMDRLLGRILELSKLDLQESEINPQPLDPDGLISDLLARFQPVLDNKQLQLHSDLGVKAEVTADARDLGAVLLNVLDNAMKYTPAGGSITVTTDLTGGHLVICCRNTHSGVPGEDPDRLFEPFHRRDQSENAGAGLGLAICRKLVDRNHGAITAASRDNNFEIEITWPVSSRTAPTGSA